MRKVILVLCAGLVASHAAAQPADPGRQTFVSRCAGCHGTDGNGGELGPNIAIRVPSRTDQDLSTVIRQGLVAAGMPAFVNLSDAETGDLVRFLRTLQIRAGSGPTRGKVTLVGGKSVEGLILNRSTSDLQLLGRRSKDSAAAKERRSVPRRDVAVRLAELQRSIERRALQPAGADQQGQRRAARAAMDFQPAQYLEPPGHARRGGRRHVRHERQRVLRARCGERPRNLALSTSADQGTDRQRRRRRESRRDRCRRPCVHGHRPRAPHRAQSRDRCARLGNRNGRLAPELLHHRRSAHRPEPGHHRRVGRRRWGEGVPGGVRSSVGKGSVAVLGRPQGR